MAAGAPSSVVGWPVVGPLGRSICNVSWMPKKAYPDVSDADYAAFNAECEANARLIAAAPELLAALKTLVGLLDVQADEMEEAGIAILPEREAARAIIDKAEGR